MARIIRIGLLFFVLVVVAQGAWIARARTTDWKEPLRVVVYPINGDGSAAADAYIQKLPQNSFEPLALYMREQARVYGLPLRVPVEMYIEVMLWSLQLRFWAWRNDAYSGPKPHVRMFIKYFAPRTDVPLRHSVGLRQGLIGVVNAFASADMEGSNHVVIAHELLHTFGATDKYDPATNQPLYPEGYAEPNANPRLPQSKAEIMAGRIPLSPTQAETPGGLDETVIGATTAREISWAK